MSASPSPIDNNRSKVDYKVSKDLLEVYKDFFSGSILGLPLDKV